MLGKSEWSAAWFHSYFKAGDLEHQDFYCWQAIWNAGDTCSIQVSWHICILTAVPLFLHACYSLFLLSFLFIYCTVAVSIGFANISVIIANVYYYYKHWCVVSPLFTSLELLKPRLYWEFLSVRISRVKFLLFLPGVV